MSEQQSQAKILLIDDDPYTLGILEGLLTKNDYVVHPSPNGKFGAYLAQRYLPDLILLDVMMPGMVGYRVCRELKNDPEMKSAFVLFLTARNGNETESTVIRSGGDDLISKPFDPKDLRARIKAALGD